MGHTKIRNMLFALLLLPLAFTSNAEGMKQMGDWDVHYMVVNSTFFSPEIAHEYGIVRSKYNVLVNISVLDSKSQEAQTVGIQGIATNLLGTEKKLNFKKVKEGDAIYYLAVFDFRNEETYRFDIEIRRGDTVENLKFKQKLLVD